ncbi:MAG: ABC transporter permease [bacterium]
MKFLMFLGQLNLERKLFLRDRQAVFWTFFFPVFLVLIFGYLFSKPNAITFGVGIVDEDQSLHSQQFIEALGKIPVLKLEKSAREEMVQKLNEHDKSIAIFINKGYADSLSVGSAQIEVSYDQAQMQTMQFVSLILEKIIAEINVDLLHLKPPIQIVSRALQPQRRAQRYIDFLLPGIIGMNVVSTCLFSIGLVVVAYREKGKLRRLAVTPLPKSIFIAGQMVNRYMIVVIQALLLIAIGMFLFKVQIVGSLVHFFLALTVGMLAFIALGFFIASVAKTTETATGIANTLFLPMIFLSGVYFSIDSVPKFLKPIVELLPLTHLVRAIRAIFNNGLTFFDVLPQMGILSLWIVAGFALSLKLFKWE